MIKCANCGEGFYESFLGMEGQPWLHTHDEIQCPKCRAITIIDNKNNMTREEALRMAIDAYKNISPWEGMEKEIISAANKFYAYCNPELMNSIQSAFDCNNNSKPQ